MNEKCVFNLANCTESAGVLRTGCAQELNEMTNRKRRKNGLDLNNLYMREKIGFYRFKEKQFSLSYY